MRTVAKHSAARKSTLLTRMAGVAVASGVALAGGMAAAPSASAAPSDVWDRVAACESGGNWKISTGNGYHGGLQFSASSWRAAGGTRYASMPHKASKSQQIAAAKNLLRMQGPGAWPVCSKKAGLNRSNGGSASGGSVSASRGSERVSHSSRSSRVMAASQVRALQRKVGARVDGIIGPETVRKTESYLGLKRSGLSFFSSAKLAKAKALV